MCEMGKRILKDGFLLLSPGAGAEPVHPGMACVTMCTCTFPLGSGDRRVSSCSHIQTGAAHAHNNNMDCIPQTI